MNNNTNQRLAIVEQLLYKTKNFKLFCVVITSILASVITTAYAEPQTGLISKFKNDLDASMLRAYEGDRDAQFNVGVLFTSQEFQQPDHEQAAYWYKQAARQGHSLAQYNLGHLYMDGNGVLRNEKSAMHWWLKSAKQGHVLAQFNVGRGYYLGIGLEENRDKARFWFEQAAKQKEPKSTHILQQLGWTENLTDVEAPQTNSPLSEPDQIETVDKKKQTIQANPTPSNQGLTPTTPDNDDAVISKTDSSSNTNSATNNQPIINTPETTTPLPIAVYTNPKINSVLISIVNDVTTLKLVERGKSWSSVVSDQGFPVWVHSNYLNVTGKQGTLTGSSVNARSVPIISKGTIVGELEKGEIVTVISQQKKWYRVISPTRFKAWAKTLDIDKASQNNSIHTTDTEQETSKQETTEQNITPPTQTEQETANAMTTLAKFTVEANGSGDENSWLFNQPADNFTLQLASFGTAEAINNFLSRPTFIDNPDLHQFISTNNNIDWTYFLYGSYPKKANAEKAKKDLGQKNAWIRSFRQLRQNRCITWKQQLPPPKELNKHCRN